MASKLSLRQLSRLIRRVTPDEVLSGLRESGVVVGDVGAWQSLSGGREYSHIIAKPHTVDGILSALTVEVSRMASKPAETWVDSIILSPGEGAATDWVGAMRRALARSFQPESGQRPGAEAFSDELTVSFLLVAAGPAATPCVIVRRKNPVRPQVR